MRLLFIRHGDPDYANDTLTEKGHREAKLLAEHMKNMKIDAAYVSPLGRAQDTAAYALKALDMTGETLDWLQEFPAFVDPNTNADVREAYATALIKEEETGLYRKRVVWDILPSYYGKHPELFDAKEWRNAEILKGTNIVETYDHIIASFDQLLACYGYEKDGCAFRVQENNEKTIAFFCHYGITSVLLSHLWNVSPFVPLQFTVLLPTSVTEVASEERQKGIATFRTMRAGDISHLAIGGEEPAFSARFCEVYENMDQRH